MAITYGEVTTAKVTDEPRYGRTASGYGRKIPTRYMVQLVDDPRWRRVYVMQFSNSGSAYVVVNGEDVFLHDTDLEWALHAAGATV